MQRWYRMRIYNDFRSIDPKEEEELQVGESCFSYRRLTISQALYQMYSVSNDRPSSVADRKNDCSPFEVTEQNLRELHEHYGNSPAEFTQRATSSKMNVGDRRRVMLSTTYQRYLKESEEATSDVYGEVIARQWDEHSLFWTLDLRGRRLIVKHFGGGFLHAWLGIDRGFEDKIIVHLIGQTASPAPPLSEDISSLSLLDEDETSNDRRFMKEVGMDSESRSDPSSPRAISESSSLRTAREQFSTESDHSQKPTKAMVYILEGYDIGGILSRDRTHYWHTLPPFVFQNPSRMPYKILAVLADEEGKQMDIRVEALLCSWDDRHSYWTIPTQGQEYLVKKRQGGYFTGYSFKVWLGAELGFHETPIACPLGPKKQSGSYLKRKLKIKLTRSIEIYEPKDNGPSHRKNLTRPKSLPQSQHLGPTPQLPKAQSPLARPRNADTSRMDRRPIESITRVSITDFDDYLERLREYYGLQKPEFIHYKEGVIIGKTTDVVEATVSGTYPKPSLVHDSLNAVTTRSWDRSHLFYTLDIEPERFIVDPVTYGGRSAFQRWWGAGRGFEETVLAFAVDTTNTKYQQLGL